MLREEKEKKSKYQKLGRLLNVCVSSEAEWHRPELFSGFSGLLKGKCIILFGMALDWMGGLGWVGLDWIELDVCVDWLDGG